MKPRSLFNKGDRLGDYEIVRYLRAGGMATLFLGRRHGAAGISRPVVIKVIHPHLSEEETMVKMFIDEARISSHISHPNVVYVENFGMQEGVYFMAMEYVDGCSLDGVLKTLHQYKQTTPIDIAVHIAREAAAGLHAAHETTDEQGNPLGIVHRDISPSNVLLTRDARIKLIDFGIAKARGRLAGTRSGTGLKGKLRYMPPEQAWGKDIDRRADVYALGVTLWELLTVRPLFSANDDLSLLDLVRNPIVPSPRAINPMVPRELEDVVMRALAADPDARIQTAQQFREELSHAIPESTHVPEAALSKLVTKVRDTLGPLVDAAEDKATTPIRPTPTPMAAVREPDISAPPTTGSAYGQIEVTRPPSRSVRIAIVGTLLVGVATAGGFVATRLARSGDARDTSAATRAEPKPAVAAPVDAGALVHATPDAAPTIDPNVKREPTIPPDVARKLDAAQATKLPTRPPRRGKARPSPATGATATNVDGAVLATEPTRPKRPPKPPPSEVEVDGTVLAR